MFQCTNRRHTSYIDSLVFFCFFFQNLFEYDDKIEVERFDFRLHSISLPQQGLSPPSQQKNNLLPAEAWLKVRGKDNSNIFATSQNPRYIQDIYTRSSPQLGQDIRSTTSSPPRHGKDILQPATSPPSHSKDITSTMSSSLECAKEIQLKTSSPLQLDNFHSTTSSQVQDTKEIASRNSFPLQDGRNISLTRLSGLRDGKDIASTITSKRDQDDRLHEPRTSSPLHYENAHQLFSALNQSSEDELRTYSVPGNVNEGISVCPPEGCLDKTFPRGLSNDNQNNGRPTLHKSTFSLFNSCSEESNIGNASSKCRNVSRVTTTADKTVRDKLKTRFTQSAVEPRSRLLYLRENGICTSATSVETIISIDRPDDSETSGQRPNQRLFQRIVRTPQAHSSRKGRLNRAVSAGLIRAPGEEKRSTKASEIRKQKYLDEILQGYLDRRLHMTRGFDHFRSKPQSAPQLRNRSSSSSKIADKSNTSKSDHLIKLFEWSKMAHLRTRISGEITPAMLQFRDKVCWSFTLYNHRTILRVIHFVFFSLSVINFHHWISICRSCNLFTSLKHEK